MSGDTFLGKPVAFWAELAHRIDSGDIDQTIIEMAKALAIANGQNRRMKECVHRLEYSVKCCVDEIERIKAFAGLN